MGLFAACCGGFAAAGYAFASCRFVIINFVDDSGSFEDVLSGPSSGGDFNRNFRVAAGLFTWLNPISTASDNFDQGQCVGYRTTMLAALEEPTFEAVRIMAVIATLLSIMMLVWIMILTTLSMRRREIWFMSFWFFILTSLVGLTFLVFQSSLCQDVGMDTSCDLDEGGLVAIAACILWFVGLLVSCIFIKPLGQDLVLIDGELRSEFGERQNERKRQAEIRLMQKNQKAEARALEQEQRQESLRQSNSTPTKRGSQAEDVATPNTQQTAAGDDGGMEVTLSKTLDRIEDYCEDDDV
eukprot:CAMPEP_0119008112 /NCGR_PEP_ID=MMETSP1176-20130426/3470_1 /TAXON_ID=265551 /ORGANISM="Synedropsis recta cf, Strain CCMP1620" /LENGTH=296 /DNA_ID=CAMNT_0006960383 /DNA_START=203 /DNA_END=1096 /DNA_ORIENTATION=+